MPMWPSCDPEPMKLRSHSQGAALLLTLAAIVLLAIASVAFLTAVTLERQSASAYADGGEARVVADSVADLVMGQIREATEQSGTVWTSQPGLLRTFSATGTAAEVFKLYSSFPMRMAASAFNPASDVPSGWATRSAAYVDINRPTVSRVGGTQRTVFPILDPRAQGKVEGFFCEDWPGVSTNALPMPVAWMYITKNGALTTSDNLDPQNPPIARIAFWTDDETCKLNINTASEGNFWDIPRTSTGFQTWTDDGIRGAKSCYSLAMSQPAQREFQSYPGHPATTSLSPVLWKYFQEINPALTRDNRGGGAPNFPETLYAMLPRTSGGGSQGGTAALKYGNAAVPLKNDRLFSSVDELAFLPPTGAGTADRIRNDWFTRDTIEQIRFFLTAHSRAPEINLFNLPRVTIWPIHKGTGVTYRTAFDNLIAFASTINGVPYYFQRHDPDSMTKDYTDIAENQALYGYLQALTARPVPGFGSGTLSAKYGVDRDQILTEILDYIRCTNLNDTSSSNPAFQTYAPRAEVGSNNGQLNAWTKPGTAQILPLRIGDTAGFGRVPTLNRAIFQLAAAEDILEKDGGGAVVGGNRTLEAGLYFETFVPGQGYPAMQPNVDIRVTQTAPFIITTTDGSGVTANASFSFSGTNRVTGFSRWGIGGYEGYFGQTFQWADGLNAKFKTLNAATPEQNYPFVVTNLKLPLAHPGNPDDPSSPQAISVAGGSLRVELIVRNTGVIYQTLDLNFPSFVTTLPKVAEIRGYDKNNPGETLQPSGISARFPKSTNPNLLPGLWNYRQLSRHLPDQLSSGTPVMTERPFLYSMFLFRDEDVIRSLEPEHPDYDGDMRLIAASAHPGNALVSMSDAGGSDQRSFSAMATISESQPSGQLAHWYSGWNSLTGGRFSLNDNKSWGRLVKDEARQGASAAGHPLEVSTSLVPASLNGVVNHDGRAGDFDTGIGSSPDGPYINKSDEGSVPDPSLDVPYVRTQNRALPPGETFSSPSRQVPSPVAFGSLPTGVKAGHPWQTLLFNPVPASLYGADNPGAHPGEADPPDHLLLDLFHIPVVEPYAISEPFSTAGKVNMNYQMIPFTGIERSTALHGALYPVRVTAIRSGIADSYKYWQSSVRQTYRYPVNVPETLTFFEDRFQSTTKGHVFKSASEICEIPLVPSNDTSAGAVIPLRGDPYGYTGNITRATLDDFWRANRVTGDNLREQPYNILYPRLTTRSNTFTIHVWVQTLKKLPGTAPQEWIEGRDRVTAEYRGSFLIERYLNPAEKDIPDYVAHPTGNLNAFYRFRVISAKQFDP